jgi:hypothetical protein
VENRLAKGQVTEATTVDRRITGSEHRAPWGNDYICNDLDLHPVHAEWLGSGGRGPTVAGKVPFLMKDVVLLAVAIYPRKQDVVRMSHNEKTDMTLRQPTSTAFTQVQPQK